MGLFLRCAATRIHRQRSQLNSSGASAIPNNIDSKQHPSGGAHAICTSNSSPSRNSRSSPNSHIITVTTKHANLLQGCWLKQCEAGGALRGMAGWIPTSLVTFCRLVLRYSSIFIHFFRVTQPMLVCVERGNTCIRLCQCTLKQSAAHVNHCPQLSLHPLAKVKQLSSPSSLRWKAILVSNRTLNRCTDCLQPVIHPFSMSAFVSLQSPLPLS